MARRTDFAQKLLDDLRMRKERLAGSNSSNRSNQMSSDKYRYFKQTSKGLKEVNPTEKMGSITRDSQKWLGSNNRRPAIEESSRAMVQSGRARNSEQIADFSMALAFALGNGGELKKMGSSSNSVVGFLNQFGQRSVEFGEMDGSLSLGRSRTTSGRYPTLSHLHIKEISRGAQKLNQILKACNNGLNFDTYSIDIGKELLQGAIDLEESLRMLVSLQDASEYMDTPKRKQKLRIVEVDDNDEEITVKANKEKQLDLPRFSFDRPSKNTVEDTRGTKQINALRQRLLALSLEAPQPNSEKQTPSASTVVSHRRSASCGPSHNSALAIPTPKKHSSSADSPKERGRIPNVIAKLMGLEELPTNIDSKVGGQTEPQIKQGTRAGNDSTKQLKESARKTEQLTGETEKSSRQSAVQKVTPANKSSRSTAIRLVPYSDKAKESKVPSKPKHQEEKSRPKPKTAENKNLVSNSTKPTSKTNTLQIDMAPSPPNAQITMDKQEKMRMQDNPTPKEQKSNERAATREMGLKDDFQLRELAKAANAKQENTRTKEIAHQEEKRISPTRLPTASNPHKPLYDGPSQPSNKLRKSESRFAKLQDTKTKLQMKKQKGNEKILKNQSTPKNDAKILQKKLPRINHARPTDATPSSRPLLRSNNENLSRKENSPNVRLKVEVLPIESLEERRPSPLVAETAAEVAAPVSPVMITNPVHIFPKQKIENTQVHETVEPSKMEKARVQENASSSDMAKAAKSHQISVSEESKPKGQVNIESLRDEEARISLPKEAEASTENLIQDMHLEAECILKGSPKGEHQWLNESEINSSDATLQDIAAFQKKKLQDIAKRVSNPDKASLVSLDRDQGLIKSPDIVLAQVKGPHDAGDIYSFESLQKKPRQTVKSETTRLLTENESRLKEILINSQLFVNAAEALFELQIPASVLNASANKYQDEESKLLLDCGYEVMKRKGRRKEFVFHPRTKIYVGSVRIKCLDDLVKELQKEIGTLMFCNQHGSNEHDSADSLQDMLEKDIQNRNPDVNSMWDSGWTETPFAYSHKEEVIKDVEKHLINGLLDEFTRELLPVCITKL